jgi:hypothetical protein
VHDPEPASSYVGWLYSLIFTEAKMWLGGLSAALAYRLADLGILVECRRQPVTERGATRHLRRSTITMEQEAGLPVLARHFYAIREAIRSSTLGTPKTNALSLVEDGGFKKPSCINRASQSPTERTSQLPTEHPCPSCQEIPSSRTYNAGCATCRGILCSRCQHIQAARDPISGAKGYCEFCSERRRMKEARERPLILRERKCLVCKKTKALSSAHFAKPTKGFRSVCLNCCTIRRERYEESRSLRQHSASCP